MRKHRKKEKKERVQETPTLPLTPMIDCTFLLLIFFMLACRFRSEEGKIMTHLRGGGPGNDGIQIPVRVKLLWYSPEGKPRYTKPDGRLVVKIGRHAAAEVFAWAPDKKGNMQPDWGAVRDHLEKKRVAYRPPPSEPMRKMSVIIDARKYVPFYWIVRALDTSLAAGVNDIQFAAPEIPY
ncbi:MAG: biopolymer transporter ExbD [Planctomycetota bacterium]|jgi:biopolymer transport protein ExbD